MNTNEALKILKEIAASPNHTPMEQDLWIKAIVYFRHHKNPKAIPLLIKTFGEENYTEIYLCIQVTLQHYRSAEVLPHLLRGISSKNVAIRCWCADTIRFFPKPDAIPDLTILLQDKDPLARYEAAVALECIPHRTVGMVAADALMRETDEHVRNVLRDLIRVA